MRTEKFIIFNLLLIITWGTLAQSDRVAVGQWRDHLSHYFTHAVCKVEDKVLVAGRSALFFYNPHSKKTEKFNKVNGLSDAGIGQIAYDNITKSIVITYENSNIDIVCNNRVYNIPDIKDRIIEGSKAINGIFFYNSMAYLSCGFGVVVLNLQRHEIYDTWYLGENSSAINVNCIYIDDTSIFAGTVDGLLYADKRSKNLASSQTWKNKNISDNDNKQVINILPYNKTSILLQIHEAKSPLSHLIKYDGVNKDTVKKSEYIVKVKKYGDEIGIINYLSFTIYDTNLNQLYHYSSSWNPIPDITVDFRDFYIDSNNSLWLSHYNKGLIHIPHYKDGGTGQREIIYPMGPLSNDVFNMTFDPKGTLYVAPGGKDITSANKYMIGDVYVYNGEYWDHLDYGEKNDTVLDVLDIAIDPKDNSHIVAASWWNGILDIKNNVLQTIFDSTNTDNLLQSQGYSYRVATVKYDRSGNMFAALSLVPYGFVYKTFNNEWGNFYTHSYIGGDEVRGMTLDNFNSYKLIYTVNNKILLINNQGEMKLIDPNNGALLQSSMVNCITQDKEGELWIGTEKGIKVIYSLNGAFDVGSPNYNVECNNIVYSEEGIAQYLLSFENINCIMVDGANRKWIGTERSGIYVLSPNGDKELYHFTWENSPLFSNKIICMAQNPKTGEVFIGTDRGLISYRAESLEPETEDIELSVFPNPIRPDYNGLIAIKGFVNDSDVRITDANGRMVAHLKSFGGQTVWDGRNFQGQKVASGVYFVFSSANEGTNKAKGKFLIVK